MPLQCIFVIFFPGSASSHHCRALQDYIMTGCYYTIAYVATFTLNRYNCQTRKTIPVSQVSQSSEKFEMIQNPQSCIRSNIQAELTCQIGKHSLWPTPDDIHKVSLPHQEDTNKYRRLYIWKKKI